MFASILVECSDKNAIGNGDCSLDKKDECAAGKSCCMKVVKSSFVESFGSQVFVPPERFAPAYPADYKIYRDDPPEGIKNLELKWLNDENNQEQQ